MKFILDGKTYDLNLTNVSKYLQQWYEANKNKLDKIETENGKTIDFSRKSVLRIAFKTAFMPIALPALKMTYRMKGSELPPHVRHEDFIDYFMHNAFGAIALFDKEKLYVESLESPYDDSRLINSVTTHAPIQIPTHAASTEEPDQEEGSSARGETLLHSRQNGYGQDEVNQRDYTEEVVSPTDVKRLPRRYEEEG